MLRCQFRITNESPRVLLDKNLAYLPCVDVVFGLRSSLRRPVAYVFQQKRNEAENFDSVGANPIISTNLIYGSMAQ